jgi:cell division protein FtsL
MNIVFITLMVILSILLIAKALYDVDKDLNKKN